MAERPKLRVLPGGACPPSMRRGVEREMESRLEVIVRDLDVLAASARDDLDDEDLFGAFAHAVGGVHLVRLALERRKS